MKVVVLGAGGQLGTEISKLSKVYTTDDYILYDQKTLDLVDSVHLRTELLSQAPDVVINCAAYTNVTGAESNEGFVKAENVNWKSLSTLACTCKQIGTTLIHISTDYVFSGNNAVPYVESDLCFPINWYGYTKFHGECEIEKSGCKYIVLRTSWLYSSHGNNFLLTVKKLLEENTKLKMIVDQIGTPTWAQDLAKAIVTIINNRQLNTVGVYNYSNEGVASWYDFAIAIQDFLPNLATKLVDIVPCRTSEIVSKVERPRYTVLDKTLFKRTFDQKIPYWRDSLKQCIEELG